MAVALRASHSPQAPFEGRQGRRCHRWGGTRDEQLLPKLGQFVVARGEVTLLNERNHRVTQSCR